jgi:hypothetical protein
MTVARWERLVGSSEARVARPWRCSSVEPQRVRDGVQEVVADQPVREQSETEMVAE